MASDADRDKMSQNGLDLSKLIELCGRAATIETASRARADSLAAQKAFIDTLLQEHLDGASIDSHLALIGAGRRMAELVAEGEVA